MSPAAPAPAPALAPASGRVASRASILIVDDLPEKHLVLRSILEELGENLVSAHSGREALARLLDQEFAVILLDINMPDIDGLETASLIRRHRRSARTPILFITAYVDDLQARRGYALGAVDYIPSPVVPEVLRSKVRVFVELFQMQRRLQVHAAEREALARAEAARAAAEEANQRKNEFLAMLAHELRNPLAPIRNAVHILHNVQEPSDTLSWARDVIGRQADHLTRLIDDLLDVSRIVQGKVTVRMAPITLAQVVEHCVESMAPRLAQRQQVLRVTLPPAPVPLQGDPVRLAQVLVNLVHNASKFSPPGTAIELCARLQAGQVQVSVIDQGCGLDPALRPRIFDLFVQGEQALDRSEGGLGIGLTLVRHLVGLHGGRVEAHSDGPGQGTRVDVFLPVAGGPGAAQAPGAACTPKEAPLAQDPARAQALAVHSRTRVLVVDDQPASAQSLRLLLEMEGFEVRVAHDGREALREAPRFRPQAVLLDIGLPGMSGFEEACRLREDPVCREALLIALTGYGEAESRQRSAQAGFDVHMVKPADVDRLLALLADPQAARQRQEA